MSDTRKLSNDEVSALLDGLNDGVLDVGSGILPEKDYKKCKDKDYCNATDFLLVKAAI